MNELYLSIILGLIVLIVIFVIDYHFILKPKYKILTGKKKSKKKKNIVIGEIELMRSKHKFTIPSDKLKSVIFNIALINAFIIASTSTIIMLIPWHMFWQFLIGFVLLFGLIYAIYELYGRKLEKKYGSDKK